MPTSKAQQKAVRKYKENNYDRLEISVDKGKKATLQAHADKHDGSLNKFVNRAIDNQIVQDNAKAGEQH